MIKHIIITTLTTLVLASVGCTDAEPKESEAIGKITEQKPVFTSNTLVNQAVTEKATPVDVEPKKPDQSDAADVPETIRESVDPSLEPEIETVDGLAIRRFITTSEIIEREPAAPGASFGSDHEKIYAFIETSNESSSDKQLMVHFIGPDSVVSGGIELRIPASVPRWRTWAYTRHAKKPGLWRVEIRDLEGNLLGVLPFEVQAET